MPGAGTVILPGARGPGQPGYDPNVKMRLLSELRDQADILLCIYAGDIERKKIRADFGITYDSDALKLIDDARAAGVRVGRGTALAPFDLGPHDLPRLAPEPFAGRSIPNCLKA